MVYIPEPDDPFGATKVPSLSWRGLPIGSTFTLEILAPAKILQSRDFSTGELAYWDEEKKNPVLSAVVNVLVQDGPHSVGEERAIWAQRPSNLYAAIATAQKDAGAKVTPRGILRLRFSGEKPHENPRFHAIKEYQARYTPPALQEDAFLPEPSAAYRVTPQGVTPVSLHTGGPAKPTW